MKRRCAITLVALLLAAAASAQTTPPATPTQLEVIVIPTTGDPVTIAGVAQRTSTIGPADKCNLPPTTGGTGPLVNPQWAEVDDPFLATGSGRVCRVPMPAGMPDGSWRAVSRFIAPSCVPVVGGPTVTPCPSARSLVGVPPFQVAPILGQPAVPTNLGVRQ